MRTAPVLLVVALALGMAAPTYGAPVLCFFTPATIVGTAGSDLIVGTPGNDVIHAGGGADVVRGGLGDDRICAGPGADVVRAGWGSDFIFGVAGDDVLSGEGGWDQIYDGFGSDVSFGGPGPDVSRPRALRPTGPSAERASTVSRSLPEQEGDELLRGSGLRQHGDGHRRPADHQRECLLRWAWNRFPWPLARLQADNN